MSEAINNLLEAMARAIAIRPKVGGFPYLAEVLRLAGVKQNVWHLPSCQSLYITDKGSVVMQGQPLATGPLDVPNFDRQALITAIRTDQAGKSTFPEFLAAAWSAGVIRYDAEFAARTVSYKGCCGEEYVEEYASVNLDPSVTANNS